MRALSTRDRTVSEMRAFLERKRVEPAAIDAAVAELTKAGLLDDARYARQFAQDKRDLARWGAARIERDLHKRGIERGLIEQALASSEGPSELDNAVALLRERFEPPRTTASETGPGGCSSAADTSRSWPTRPSGGSARATQPA